MWQSNPLYHISYEELLNQNRVPQTLTNESDYHQSYSTCWICTNDTSDQIEIDFLNKVMKRKGRIIANVKPLLSGELEVTSIDTGEKSHIVITIEMRLCRTSRLLMDAQEKIQRGLGKETRSDRMARTCPAPFLPFRC